MIKISEAKPDIEEIKEISDLLYKTWLDTYPNEELGIGIENIKEKFKDRLDENKLKIRLEYLENKPKNDFLFVAREGDLVVGYSKIVVGEKNNELISLYVLPAYQRKGVGEELWNFTLKKNNPNLDTIVKVAVYNRKAINFYNKLGLVDTGKRFEDEKFRFENGAIIPEMEMIKKKS